ncbi:MAG: hypothetical protein ABS76_15540 [Pelagibacterium sp. SCN 64-44]|nr:MAG: hypothetical protein ABS76_15540 [Pelagibacterium sp. SCN 64-44]
MRSSGESSTGQPPIIKPTKIIALMAFVRDEEGELRPAFDAREMQSEGAAKMQARLLAASENYEGVIAWWRSADLTNGEFGEPVTIFEWGELPEME